MEKIKLIYISGMGRSGSTVLDMVISTNEKVFSLGEFQSYGKERENTNSVCACGEKLSECQFWGRFNTADDFRIINRVNLRDYTAILLYLLNPYKRAIHFSRKSENDRLFSALWPELKAKGYEFLLDSSKDVGRLSELYQNPHIDLYNISIVRDGRAVASAFREKSQGPGKNYFISLLKWVFANAVIRAYIRKSRLRTLHISYDRLCKNPETELKRIEGFTGLRIPSDYASHIRSAQDYHNVGGNRIRRKANREKFERILYDEKWKRTMNPILKIIFSIIVWPFNKGWNV